MTLGSLRYPLRNSLRRRWLLLAVVVVTDLLLYLFVCREDITFFHSDPINYHRLRGATSLSAEMKCALLLASLPVSAWLIGKAVSFFQERITRPKE